MEHCMRVLSHFSCVQLCVTVWTAACQAPLSMGFSRQEYWSGLLGPPPGTLPDSGIEPVSTMSIYIGRWVLYHWCHLGSPIVEYNSAIKNNEIMQLEIIILSEVRKRRPNAA